MKRNLTEDGETQEPSKKQSLPRIRSLLWTRSDGAQICSGVPLVPQNRKELKRIWGNCPYILPRCYIVKQERPYDEKICELDDLWNQVYFCTNPHWSIMPFNVPDTDRSPGYVRTESCISAVLLDPVTYKPFFLASTLEYGVSIITPKHGCEIGEQCYDKKELVIPKEARKFGNEVFKLGHIGIDLNMGKYYLYALKESIVVVVDHYGSIERVLDFPTNGGIAFLGGNYGGNKLAVVYIASMFLVIYDNRSGVRTPFTFNGERSVGCVQIVHKVDIIVVLMQSGSDRIVLCNFEHDCLSMFDLPMRCGKLLVEPSSAICHLICGNSKWCHMDVLDPHPHRVVREVKPNIVGFAPRIGAVIFYPPNFQWIPWMEQNTMYPTEWDKKQVMKFLRCGLLGRKRGCIPPSDSPNLLRLLPLDAFYVLTEFLLNELQFQ